MNWLIWHRAKRFGVRPSELLGVENTWDAFCYDEAVDVYCMWIQGQLDSLKKTKKESDDHFANRRQRMLMGLLGQKDKIKFASPG